MNKNQFIKVAKEKYKELFGDRYDDKIASESAENLWNNSNGNPDRALGSLQYITDKSSRMKEHFSNLEIIKSELFSANDEVKSAFNTIVNYFITK